MVLKVGIISANWGAYAHRPAWEAVEGVEVTAICTSRRETAEAASERFNIPRAFWNAEEMAADPDLDIIDIGTRPNLRHAMVLAALRNGKHVYNGVPMAKNLDDARDMHGAWREAGTVAVVDAFSQWIPALAKAKQMVDAGYVGTLMGGSCRFNMALFNRPDPRFPYNWFSQGGLGVSSMRNNGSHLLHYLTYLLGPIDEVVADDSLMLKEWVFADGDKLIPENPDCANVLLRFACGIVMPIQVCWTAAQAEGWAVDVWGTEGRVLSTSPIFPTTTDCKLFAGKLVSGFEHTGSLQPVTIEEEWDRNLALSIDASYPVPPAYPMALSMNAMVAEIRGTGTAAPNFEQAWQVERVQEAIRRSSLERRWVGLADIA
jgi:predicted dehydrogenase